MQDAKTTRPGILLVDDDPGICLSFSGYLSEVGYAVSTANNRSHAQELLSSQRFDAVLLDINLPDANGLEWTTELRENYPGIAIIIITGHGDIPLAVEAMQRGADNFLAKPVDMKELHIFLQKSLELGSLRRTQLASRRMEKKFVPYWGDSYAIKNTLEVVRLAVENDSPVLIHGETGSGKGIMAHWIHDQGPLSSAPFVEVNCSTLRGELLTSELFGHARGAFTGAVKDRDGLVGVADGGTLFLDEIGDMDLSVQSQFLKVIEEKQYRRVGETRQRRSDFRLISATNKDLLQETKSGRFRIDLFFRINVLPIMIPPLRHRLEDLPGLARSILAAVTKSDAVLSPDVLRLLEDYPWPGNLRELRNVLERAVLLSGGKPLSVDHFPGIQINEYDYPQDTAVHPAGANDQAAIMAEIKRCGSVPNAAKALGISRATLYRRLKSFRQEG